VTRAALLLLSLVLVSCGVRSLAAPPLPAPPAVNPPPIHLSAPLPAIVPQMTQEAPTAAPVQATPAQAEAQAAAADLAAARAALSAALAREAAATAAAQAEKDRAAQARKEAQVEAFRAVCAWASVLSLLGILACVAVAVLVPPLRGVAVRGGIAAGAVIVTAQTVPALLPFLPWVCTAAAVGTAAWLALRLYHTPAPTKATP
jgi:hypothetical protein